MCPCVCPSVRSLLGFGAVFRRLSALESASKIMRKCDHFSVTWNSLTGSFFAPFLGALAPWFPALERFEKAVMEFSKCSFLGFFFLDFGAVFRRLSALVSSVKAGRKYDGFPQK